MTGATVCWFIFIPLATSLWVNPAVTRALMSSRRRLELGFRSVGAGGIILPEPDGAAVRLTIKAHGMNGTLDVFFRVIGAEAPADHGYALFGAISRILETEDDRWMHGNPHVGLHTIRGANLGNGRRLIGSGARFGLRLPSELLPRSLKLAGKCIDLDGCKLRVGVGEIRALVPAATLHCRIATTKNGDDPARFDGQIARQRASLGIRGNVMRAPESAARSDRRDPSRRILRVKGKRIVGHALLATELTTEESILLQKRGLGGRRRMGCGVFVPVTGRP